MNKIQITLGKIISGARKKLNMSQKELASRIMREDSIQISPQYLNDIEHDRRSPSSSQLIDQFSDILKIDRDYLYYLAGRLPEDILERKLDTASFKVAMSAFRTKIKK